MFLVIRTCGIPVALRKESVDRNPPLSVKNPVKFVVALRKESVDRNTIWGSMRAGFFASLSARRAWIEISCTAKLAKDWKSRSPQGERG